MNPKVQKTAGAVALVLGIVLLLFGISAMNSFASDITEALTGQPTDRAMWLLIAGVVLTVSGSIFVSSKA